MAQDKHRKELLEEPDPIAIRLQQIVQFIGKYQKQLIITGVSFAVFVLIISGGVYFLDRSEDKAAVMLARAIDRYETVQAGNPSPADYETLKEDFQAITDKYGYTDAGKMALVQYASVLYAAGDYENAVDAYRSAHDHFKGNSRFDDLLLNGLAYAYDAAGDHENAIKTFERIAENENAVSRDQALFNLGRLYGRLGNAEKSRSAYERIVSDYPDSIYSEPAKMKLAG